MRGLVMVLVAVLAPVARAQQPAAGEWPAYGRDAGGARYSPLTEIGRDNVARLEVAWVHRTGDDMPARGRFQSTPILVDGTLYVTTPLGRVNALDPATGRERWSYDPAVRLDGDYGDFANRGVSTWLDTAVAAGVPCRRRLFVAPIDARLIALDAATGRPCADFGENGTVHLGRELDLAAEYAGEYQVTSPPAVLGDVVIVGSAIADNQRTDAPSGVVRAYDARSGRLRWAWHPVPRSADDPSWSSWDSESGARSGAANVWSVIATDPPRDLVFLPTSSPSPDYFGGARLGANAHANSLVVLRGSTGELVWSRQLVHHDLWDYDLASPPALFTMRRDGADIPAVAQATKMGMLFLFHRETGEPLHPIEERPVPGSDVAGEKTWPTQPFPVLPASFIPHRITPDDAFGVDEDDRAACRARIAALRSEGIYTPPSLRGTLVVPGNVGGSNWGGVAVDEGRGLIVGAANHLPFVITLIPRERFDEARRSGGGEFASQRGTPYGMRREAFMSPRGIPCVAPPFGTLTAVDAASGETRWQVPLGYVPALAEQLPEARRWGSLNLGGPIVTASGLVFIAATADAHLRAIDVESGRDLWSGRLPAGGFATPMTYEHDGRQFVVVAAGGHDRLPFGDTGDWLVAFALPLPGTAPATSTATDVAGTWRGDLRLGRGRWPATLELRVVGDSVAGTLRAAADGLSFGGDVAGTVREGRLRYVIPFRESSTGCIGTLTGEAEVVNYGAMLSGRVNVESNCGSQPVERGAFGLRRAQAADSPGGAAMP